MSTFTLDGAMQISSRTHTVEYDLSSMVGGSTLYLRVSGGNKNVPIFYTEIDEVIEMLEKVKLVIFALERDKSTTQEMGTQGYDKKGELKKHDTN